MRFEAEAGGAGCQAAIRRQMTLGERRARNRSLCSVLCSPPPYGLAYSAWMGNLSQLKLEDIAAAEREFSLGPPPEFIRSCYTPRDLGWENEVMFVGSGDIPHSKTFEADSPNDYELDCVSRGKKSSSSNPSASSGYGSTSSESDQEQNSTTDFSSIARRSRFMPKADRKAEKQRRNSVPATLRPAYSEDVMRVLEKDGYVRFETNIDTGARVPVVDMRTVRQNESVLDLARKFAELNAQQEKARLHSSWHAPAKSGPSTIKETSTGKQKANPTRHSSTMLIEWKASTKENGETKAKSTSITADPRVLQRRQRESRAKTLISTTAPADLIELKSPPEDTLPDDFDEATRLWKDLSTVRKSRRESLQASENRMLKIRQLEETQFLARDHGLGSIASLGDKPRASAMHQNPWKQMPKSNTSVSRPMNPNSAKEALLRWIQNKIRDYPIEVTNFSSSWANGMAFCALIHRFAPNAFDFSKLDPKNRRENFELAFRVAEENGVCPLLEVDDMIMMGDKPDYKCIFTFCSSFYQEFRNRP
ncbi:unnamed protein product, partial [Mesorhabditis belari]|uniref:Calponin-homology (CH) domain-containing protein n=1 Tax=Mesorhabditis belari TaxID=2138241 RepID=A0AAF3J208_9BILA